MAEALKQQHVRDHPGYQYQPRKPVEKKRRMTRRKYAALAKMSTVPGIVPPATMSPPVDPYVEEEAVPTLPEFSKTKEGNVVLGIGADAVGVGMFGQMLQQHNSNVQPLNHQVGQIQANDFSAIHSTGVSSEVIAERDYLASIWENENAGTTKDELASGMGETLKDCYTLAEMMAAAGVKDHGLKSPNLPSNAYDDTELSRMSNLWP